MNKHSDPAASLVALPRLRARGAALMLALGLAGAAGLVTAQPAPPPPAASMPDAHMHGGPMHHHGGPMGGRHMDRLLERVNATPEQRTKIHAIFDAARTDMRAQADTRKQLHEQGLNLMAQPTIDARAVESLRQQMLAQHDQASKRWTQAMVDAANVLTPQQRAQLAEEMRKHAERGPGPHGWGR
jgi:Spy/CpxP family protein refolding chaperone